MYNNGVHRNKRADDDKEDDCFPNPVDDNLVHYDMGVLEPEVLEPEGGELEDVSVVAVDALVGVEDALVEVEDELAVVEDVSVVDVLAVVEGALVEDAAVAAKDVRVAAAVPVP
jgi:hypothetical protein